MYVGFPEDAIFSKARFNRRAIVLANSIDELIKFNYVTTAKIVQRDNLCATRLCPDVASKSQAYCCAELNVYVEPAYLDFS